MTHHTTGNRNAPWPLLLAAAALVTTTGWPSPSDAQEAAAPPEDAAPVIEPPGPPPTNLPEPPVASAPSAPPPPMAPPAGTAIVDPETPRAVAVEAPTAPPDVDLDVEAHPWAIGYSGLSQVPIGLTTTGTDMTIPAIGLRYWTSPTVGIDLALGFGWTDGSSKISGSNVDKSALYGFLLQGGVPLALSRRRHLSFQVVPYAAIAHGGTSSGTGPGKVDFSGTRFDLGARAGFELFFGFIGMPELALNATVGVQFELRQYSADNGSTTSSDTTYGISTTVQNNPWDIFAGNVAARYYF